ncbi:hypothetical protein HK103_007590 [Boothiomyces macroporosus]|uniref:Uncharacterized protein n=1 Tax=Boothiomyces macroporosus TaxID=261099 RepID=A0AAD5Y1C1_9FUNG|nr:hypothetical protein HK103_007590 [Boothiomyces macroporosus]
MEGSLFYFSIIFLIFALLLVSYYVVKQGLKSKTVSLVKFLQLGALGSSLFMLFGRLGMDISGLIGNDCPLWILVVFTVSEFLYFLTSNLYYLELLKPLSAAFTSKYLKNKYPLYYQAFVCLFNVIFNFATIFRFSLFTDGQNTFLAHWAGLGAAVIIETAILGIAVAAIIYSTIASLSISNQKERFGMVKWFLLLFVIVQMLQFASYIISGILRESKDPNLNRLDLPLAAIGTGISGIQICIFTFIFEQTLKQFISRTAIKSTV